MSDQALASAIDAASAELEKLAAGGKEPDDSENEIEVEQEESQSDDEPQEEELTEDQKKEAEELEKKEIQEARVLFNALKDPAQRGPVIAALMNAAGIEAPTKESTKTEVKEAKKATLELVTEALGKEYGFLAERVSKAFDAVMAQKSEEVSSLKAEIDQDKLVSETKSAENELIAETKGDFKKYESQILKLIDQYPKGDNLPVKEYLKGLYTIASAGKTVGKTKADLANRINKNFNDSAGRLRSQGKGNGIAEETAPEFRGKDALQKSVDYALKKATSSNAKK